MLAQKTVANWVHSRFGPQDQTSRMEKLCEEFQELLFADFDGQQQDKREEAADVMICLLAYADAAGFDLAAAVAEKFSRLQRRQWLQTENGTWERVRDHHDWQ